MNEMPDFSRYTLKELHDVYNAVDREKYPENFRAIAHEISKRKLALTGLYGVARTAYEDEGDLLKGRKLFQQIVDEYPGTREAERASEYIADIPEKEIRLRGHNDDMNLEFSGSGKEYFRIWIVNLCLTLLTFGIFSAWAKIRKKRYFYSCLTLDGTPFQYLAKPAPILKGRVIAAVLFLFYYSSTHLFTGMFPYVLGAGLVIAPWVIVQSVAFNCRYSAYRNMTFFFTGTYREALKVISAWGIIPAFVAGTIFNWWGKYWIAGIVMALFGILSPWWMRRLKNFVVTNTSYGGHSGQFGATGGDFFRVYFMSGLIVSGFALITGFTVFIIPSAAKDIPYASLIFTMPVYAGYVIAYAYVQANMTNTVWNQIRIGPLRFHCSLRSFDLVKLYLTNAIGIITSAGLLIPWAVIRTFRYRTDHTQVINMAELTEFRGSKTESVHAAGAELTEFFDMDLSL